MGSTLLGVNVMVAFDVSVFGVIDGNIWPNVHTVHCDVYIHLLCFCMVFVYAMFSCPQRSVSVFSAFFLGVQARS